MSPWALKAEALDCGYPGKPVLSGVNLTLEKGSITVLLGPNGSGKSTLLKTLSGTLKRLGGSLEVAGRNGDELSAKEMARLVAVVPPEEKFEFPFTVREAVTMGRLPYADSYFDSPEDKAVAEAAMEQAECLELAERPVTEISAGESQRVLLARALAQQAPIMLLDEPTSHLDPAHQVTFVKLVKRLAATGLTVVAAIHDLNLVPVFADRAVLIGNGRALVVGEAEGVLRDPLLEDVYGVGFERTEGAGGLLRLHPQFMD